MHKNKINKHISEHINFNKFQWTLIICNIIGCFTFISILFVLVYNQKMSTTGLLIDSITPILSIVASISNLFCILFLSKKKVVNFYYGIIAVILFSIISILTKNYGFALLNVYYLVMNIAGIFIWNKQKTGNIVKTRSLNTIKIIIILCCDLVGIIGFTFLFNISKIQEFFNGSEEGNKNWLYWLKLIMNAGSLTVCITAMALVSFSYKEQWQFWIVANVFTLLLWVINIIDFASNKNNNWQMNVATSCFTLFTYSFSLTNSVYTYCKWKKGIAL